MNVLNVKMVNFTFIPEYDGKKAERAQALSMEKENHKSDHLEVALEYEFVKALLIGEIGYEK